MISFGAMTEGAKACLWVFFTWATPWRWRSSGGPFDHGRFQRHGPDGAGRGIGIGALAEGAHPHPQPALLAGDDFLAESGQSFIEQLGLGFAGVGFFGKKPHVDVVARGRADRRRGLGLRWWGALCGRSGARGTLRWRCERGRQGGRFSGRFGAFLCRLGRCSRRRDGRCFGRRAEGLRGGVCRCP